jgi:NAD-dependent dihydropyrimidine dehydrogenase PreA subunit
VAVGRAPSALFSLTVFDPEAVGLCEGHLHVQQVRLTGSVGIVANPAGKSSLSVPHDVQVVQVLPVAPETCICLCGFCIDQIPGVALEAQFVGLRIIGHVLSSIKTLYRKGRLPLVKGVTIRTISFSQGFMQVPCTIHISCNTRVAFKTVTCGN